MKIRIDLQSSVPQYEQIRAQLAGEIAGGGLKDGDRLPTVRTLAADLGIAPGTVAHAYRELEAAHLATSRRRHGTVVTAPGRDQTFDNVTRLAERLVQAARDAGMPDQAVVDLLRGRLMSRAHDVSPAEPQPRAAT
jgi:GntR family transcriptional regulator